MLSRPAHYRELVVESGWSSDDYSTYRGSRVRSAARHPDADRHPAGDDAEKTDGSEQESEGQERLAVAPSGLSDEEAADEGEHDACDRGDQRGRTGRGGVTG